GCRQALGPLLAMRADGEAMRFIPKALDIKQQCRVWRQRDFTAPWQVEDLPTLTPVVRALGDTHHRHVMNAGVLHDFADRRQLPLAAIDEDKVGPFATGAVGVVLLKPGEAPLKYLAHHSKVVARSDARFDVELSVIVLAEALRSGDDHRAGGIGAHDMAVVIDFDALW